MSRYKSRTATAKHGFIPQVLEIENGYVSTVLDTAYVEYGTGCWIDRGGHIGELEQEMMYAMWESFNGPVPDGQFVYNICSDYRICYNPNCLAIDSILDREEGENVSNTGTKEH